MPELARSVTPGFFARVAGGLRFAVTGTPPAWFGPSAPLAPEAPAAVAGRQFDYPVGFNLRLQPRQGEGTSFAELRALADAYDLVRLVIETRKDQIEALDWQIRPRRLGGPSDAARVAAIEALLRRPDREHPWSSWVRMLLEDLFVLDAPTLYVRRTASGALWGLEVVDGATIKRLLDGDGRTPIAPEPAYQQVLKGVPAVDYTTEDLIYAPRNPRPHKVYGYSPVEQILMTVNIGLRRQVSQLNYFTEGNTPEALIGVPDAWAPEQIRQFQEYWDALLEGNLAARRHTRFVPGGLKYQPTRDVPLKDEFDEWLARVVCFAFSIPPTAFARQTNRATAEAAQGAATAEGLQPLLVWLKALIDRILADVLGAGDLEFAWTDRTPPDPATQASVAAAYVGAGIKTRNEVRAELGLDPLPDGDILTTAPPSTALPAPLAKANFDPDELRQHGQWTRDGVMPASDSRDKPADKPPMSSGGKTLPPPRVLTEGHMTNIIFNEMRSLKGPELAEATVQMGYALQNRYARRIYDGVASDIIDPTAQALIDRPNSPEAKAYAIAKQAASDVVNGAIPDLTDGAYNYNMRPSDSRALNANYNPPLPVFLQYGPFENSYPSRALPKGKPVYINIYKKK